MTKKKDPNFLLGGTSAGGTSFLSAILIQHPEIYLPRRMRPEPHYFYKSWEYEKGLDYYLSSWFSDVKSSQIAIGERSSSYLFGGKSVAEKIANQYPNMKFIFTLRNPIERTWANYRYTVLQGLENLSFEDALKREKSRILEASGIWAEIQPHNYTGRGFYALQIKEYLDFFPPENILLIKSELLSSQTDVELEKITMFLNVKNPTFIYSRPSNHTSCNILNLKLQMKLRDHFGERFDEIIESIRKEETLDNYASVDDEDSLILLTSNITGEKIDMSSKCRDYLRELFAADMSELSQLVDFAIDDWE